MRGRKAEVKGQESGCLGSRKQAKVDYGKASFLFSMADHGHRG